MVDCSTAVLRNKDFVIPDPDLVYIFCILETEIPTRIEKFKEGGREVFNGGRQHGGDEIFN